MTLMKPDYGVLRDLQRILDAALEFIAGTNRHAVSHYISWAALFISRLRAGIHSAELARFIFKTLIRPALETTFAAAPSQGS